MTENGINDGKKSAPERNTKGRFVKGNSGGPGRGKTKSRKRMSYGEIEDLLQKDLRSTDVKTRHAATKLILLLRRQPQNSEDEPVINPAVYKILGERLQQIIGDESIEVID